MTDKPRPRYVEVTSRNIKEVAEDLMMDPKELAKRYMAHKLQGTKLIFKVCEE